jgi:hypothetical protein
VADDLMNLRRVIFLFIRIDGDSLDSGWESVFVGRDIVLSGPRESRKIIGDAGAGVPQESGNAPNESVRAF